MKILICGSRTAVKYKELKELVQSFIVLDGEEVTLISGGAKGADAMAEKVAEELGLKIRVVKAEWDRYGKSAGIVRNLEMIRMAPDLVIACWDGQSKGTKHTVKTAKQKGISVKIIQE